MQAIEILSLVHVDRQPYENLLKSLQDPSISTFDYNGFKNEISASAPLSPSMTPHHIQFNTGQMSDYPGTSGDTTTTMIFIVHIKWIYIKLNPKPNNISLRLVIVILTSIFSSK